MNQYIEKLTAYIKENLLDGGQGETESVLALLEEYYLAENPVNSAQIKELDDLSLEIFELENRINEIYALSLNKPEYLFF